MGKGGEFNASAARRKISLEELGQHRLPEDAWISYKGKVYDVSGWFDHPGGSVIFTHAGDDCTDIFAAFHPASAAGTMDQYLIGDLDESNITEYNENKLKPEEQRKFEKGYRDLRNKLLCLGLFNASSSYYVYKCLSNLLILGAAIVCAVTTTSIAVNIFGAILLGLFWQQCGWLAHDFLHHQVFKNRFMGDMVGLIVGGVCQGFSVHWWKTKHNSHHAVPNLEASSKDAADGDPDIDTMPILAWTQSMADSARDSEWGKFLVHWQAFFYFPVLLFARLAWAHQSWVYVFGGNGQHSIKGAEKDRERIQYPFLEKLALIVHYVWLFMVLFHMPFLNAIIYLIIAQTSCGLFLALVFGLGHNGMAVYPASERPDFWKLQVTTTRNVTSNWFVDWFCGGLQYQVDHHLFPMIPRHNLKKVHELVKSFCKEYNVNYHEADMITGTVEILQQLSKVSAEFIKEFPAM